MDHIVYRFRGSPLTELVCLDGGQGGGLGRSDAEPVEAGGGDPSILGVKELNP